MEDEESLQSLGAKYCVVQFAIQKYKNQEA